MEQNKPRTIRHYRPDLMARAADSGGRLVEWMTDPQHIRDLTADSMAAGVRHWAKIVAHEVTEAILPRHLCDTWKGIDVWTTWAADRRRLARRDLEGW